MWDLNPGLGVSLEKSQFQQASTSRSHFRDVSGKLYIKKTNQTFTLAIVKLHKTGSWTIPEDKREQAGTPQSTNTRTADRSSNWSLIRGDLPPLADDWTGTSEKPDIQTGSCLDKGFQERATAATSEEFIHEEAKDRDPTGFQYKCGLTLTTASLHI